MQMVKIKRNKKIQGEVRKMPEQFWNFKNISNDEAELTIYGYIAQQSWYSDEVSSKKFASDLKALGNKKTITVKINSGGGDVFAAHAIYNLLKENSAKVVTMVEGIAASAASVILQAGDERIVPNNAFVMIHNPSTIAWGEAKDMVKMADTLNTIKDGIVNTYADRTGKSKEEISKMMDEETWMTGEDAVKEGFADKTTQNSNSISNIAMNNNMLIINSVSHDMSKYKNFPGFKNPESSSYKNDFDASGVMPEKTRVLEIFKDSEPSDRNLKNNKEAKITMTLEELKNAHPQLVEEISNAAREEGKKEERKRIQDIEEISNSIPKELLNKAKFETPMNAQQLAFEALKNDSKLGSKYMNNAEADSKESGAEEVPAAPEATPKAEEKRESIQDKIKNAALKFDSARRGIKEEQKA